MPLYGLVARCDTKSMRRLFRGLLVAWSEESGVDGVGNAGDLLSAQQCAALGLSLKPAAACYVVDAFVVDHLLLLLPNGCGEVSSAASSGQILALLALCGEIAASEGEVADGCGRPDVVHGPHYGLSRAQNLSDVAEGEHALVHPVQVYDVGLSKLPEACYVGSAVGNVNVEEVLSREV